MIGWTILINDPIFLKKDRNLFFNQFDFE